MGKKLTKEEVEKRLIENSKTSKTQLCAGVPPQKAAELALSLITEVQALRKKVEELEQEQRDPNLGEPPKRATVRLTLNVAASELIEEVAAERGQTVTSYCQGVLLDHAQKMQRERMDQTIRLALMGFGQDILAAMDSVPAGKEADAVRDVFGKYALDGLKRTSR